MGRGEGEGCRETEPKRRTRENERTREKHGKLEVQYASKNGHTFRCQARKRHFHFENGSLPPKLTAKVKKTSLPV